MVKKGKGVEMRLGALHAHLITVVKEGNGVEMPSGCAIKVW